MPTLWVQSSLNAECLRLLIIRSRFRPSFPWLPLRICWLGTPRVEVNIKQPTRWSAPFQPMPSGRTRKRPRSRKDWSVFVGVPASR